MDRRNQILIVDDMEINRAILCELFQQEYAVLEAENGLEALEIVRQNRDSIAVILLDIVMPVMDGFQLMERLQKEGILKRIPVILITADTFHDNEINGLNLGASDIIMKPFDPHIVKKRVENSVELYQHKNHLEDLVEHQTKKLMETNDFVVDALSTVIEYRSLESGQHIRRIRVFTRTLLEQLARLRPDYGLTRKKIDTITSASAMHDIGKIAIPDSILLKPGRLTPDEFEIMKTHTTKGCEVLQAFRRMEDKNYLRYCYNICRYHHERWDGRGYPDGLKGDEIPICAQAVAVADVYDALTSPRVYKPAFPHEKAVEMILGGECGTFSDCMMACFRQVADRFKAIGNAYNDNRDEDAEETFLRMMSIGLDEAEEAAANSSAASFQQASAALQKETLERDSLINAIPGGVAKVVVDEEFQILLASDGFYKLTGYSQAEYHRPPIDGKGIRLILEEDAAQVSANVAEQISKELPISVEYRIRKKDGSIAWISVHGTRMEIENGCSIVQAVFIDITANKRTEQKLMSLMNSIPGGIVQLRVDGTISMSFASDGFYQILGYTREEYGRLYAGPRALECIHPEDRDSFRATIMESLHAGVPQFTQECRAYNGQGHLIWLLISGSRTEDIPGQLCYQCVITDVTDPRRAQELLRMNEERYRIIIEQSQDVIFEWNMRTDTMYHSPSFQKKFGYEMPVEHFFEATWNSDIVYEDDKPAFKDFRDRLYQGNADTETEFRVKSEEGYLWCRVKATVIFDQKHQPYRAVGTLSDVDGYKRTNALLEAKAQKDLLTGLYNKVTMENLIGDCLEREGHGQCHALMILDIDNFKLINDTFGHLEGDSVLRAISSQIQECFRGEDIIGRAGGDEFVIFLKDIPSRKLARDKAEILSGIFHRFSQKQQSGYPPISASIGISLYPEDGKDFAELFRNADQALYTAKRSGKDCYCFYHEQDAPALETEILKST